VAEGLLVIPFENIAGGEEEYVRLSADFGKSGCSKVVSSIEIAIMMKQREKNKPGRD
jgi:hypothetical protein